MVIVLFVKGDRGLRILLTFSLLFLSSQALAWQDYNGKPYDFVTLKNGREVSKTCAKGKCQAAQVKIVAGEALDGEDFAVISCLEKLNGSLIQLKDEKGNQRGVCQFSDGSYLGLGSLRALLMVKKN